MHKNGLNAQFLAELIQAIRSSEGLFTLKKLQLEDCQWDQAECCEQLCNLLADAPNLQVISIINQKGSRRIQIEYKQAKASTTVGRSSEPLRDSIRLRGRGNVRIYDPANNQTIFQLQTWKQEEITISQ